MGQQRRSKRLPLSIPVRVYGRTSDNQPFRDVTMTRCVNVHGGLLPLAPKVTRGQKLLLVHSITEEERECRVVYIEAKKSGRKAVAVEFTEKGGDFWHVFSPMVNFQNAVPQEAKAAQGAAPSAIAS
jgi:hypothetical protein